MRSKNYYKILQVSHTASQSDIKKAYRKLAMLYHPDRNREPFAAAHFREIQEAYHHLSDAHRRSAYDQQNWYYRHTTAQPKDQILTAADIHKKTKKLGEYLKKIHKGDLNKKALAQYLHYLINTKTSALISEMNNEQMKKDIITGIIKAGAFIRPGEVDALLLSLYSIAGNDTEMQALLSKNIKAVRREHRFERYKILLILLITILLCLFIYLASNY